MHARVTVRAMLMALMLMMSLVGVSTAQASELSTASSRGSVDVTFDPAFVEAMFKAGVFMYGASEVTVHLSDSGSLSGSFPLTGQARARATSSVIVDPEVGGLSLYNGPAQLSAGLGSLVLRRTGTTGTVTATIVGPFSTQTGQFQKTMTVFTISQAAAAGSTKRWTMNGTITMTREAADTLNSLLKTTVFTADAPMGTVGAAVRAPSGS